MKLRLNEMRRLAKKSQQEMADALGVKKRTYGSWERGEVVMNIEQLYACAVILNCSCDALLSHELPTSFTDPREAELHAIWRGLTSKGREHVLHHAKAESALERGEAEYVERSNINTGRTA